MKLNRSHINIFPSQPRFCDFNGNRQTIRQYLSAGYTMHFDILNRELIDRIYLMHDSILEYQFSLYIR